jgi:hypothetical protein
MMAVAGPEQSVGARGLGAEAGREPDAGTADANARSPGITASVRLTFPKVNTGCYYPQRTVKASGSQLFTLAAISGRQGEGSRSKGSGQSAGNRGGGIL